MSQQQISRSKDLKRLRDEGYAISIEQGHLVVRDVPYVTAARAVERGVLVDPLALSGDVTTRPADHTVRFVGEHPHRADGRPYVELLAGVENRQVTPELCVNFIFSQKPSSGYYPDYYDKITSYVRMLEHEAQAVDASVTAQTYPLIVDEAESSVFRYMDTASSRAGISVVTDKLRQERVAIVGLGGTGSYTLDLVAKTPVGEIHLYDGDVLLQHNAFRMPGAISGDELRAASTKVAHLQRTYDKLRTGVIAHEMAISSSNVNELTGMSFVFLALTDGETKRLIVQTLEAAGVPFIDAGMGLELVNESLLGQLRVTTSTPQQRDHVHSLGRIPFSDGENNEYSFNIQIADLNALNATLAVIKWKKLCGFYADLEREHYSVYSIDGNHLLNEDTGS